MVDFADHHFDKTIAGTRYEARPYQGRIVKKVCKMVLGQYVDPRTETLKPASKSVMIESPTGSGKSCMALTTLLTLQQNFVDNMAIGWMAMRQDLLRQIQAERQRMSVHLDNFYTVSMFDKNPDGLLRAKAEGKRIVLVSDECQHDSTASSMHLHNILEPDLVLGMSATPYRVDRVKLCFDSVVRDCGIHQLIQDGYLSKFHHYTIPNWTVETVMEAYLREPDRWGKSIFYFKSIDDCWAAAKILKDNEHRHGRTWDVVTGDTDREEQLPKFASGETQLLINCMVLTEGFDEPTLKTAFVRDSGKGTTTQMGGRVFRLHGETPIKQIVQSTQTRWPFLKTALPEQQFVWQSDEWRSLTVNPNILAIQQRTMQAILETQVELPKFILNKQSKKRGRAQRAG